jgi:3-phenylpropionate/trans-cinnamate dioxygenase ferredoxin component
MSEHRIELPDPFPPGSRKLAFIEGRQILVFNLDGTLVAVENACPHAGGSLHSGKLEGRVLRCPSHGMRFDLGDPASGLRFFPILHDGAGIIISLMET